MINTDEIEKQAVEILNKPYARRLVPDEAGGYVASIQEFPGCVAEGETAAEALENLNHAASSWIEAAISTGYEIRDPVSFLEYSGKIALRIPRGLHKQAAELAEQEGTSINQLLVTAIAHYVGGRQVYSKLSASMLLELRRAMSEGLVSFHRKSPWLVSIVSPASAGLYLTDTTFEGHVGTTQTFKLGVTQ